MIEPYVLRRLKQEIFNIRTSELGMLRDNELPLKTDLIVWIPLTPFQKKL